MLINLKLFVKEVFPTCQNPAERDIGAAAEKTLFLIPIAILLPRVVEWVKKRRTAWLLKMEENERIMI